jgi:hypothetical protein
MEASLTDLSHSGEEALWVEEASHPETVGSAVEAPSVELLVSFNELSEPETNSARLPGNLTSNKE